MKVVFSIVGFLAFCFAFVIFGGSKSAIHEALAVNVMIVGSIFIVGAGIIGAISKLKIESTTSKE